MAENVTEVLTGAGVLAAAVAFVIYASGAGGMVSTGESYELKASFRSVEGISVGTDVRLAGVKIGAVTGLALNPKTFFADATVALRSDVVVPADSTIVVASEGLLGGSFVEILPGGSPDDLQPGAEIEDTQGAVSMIGLLMKFVSAKSGEQTDAATP